MVNCQRLIDVRFGFRWSLKHASGCEQGGGTALCMAFLLACLRMDVLRWLYVVYQSVSCEASDIRLGNQASGGGGV